MVSSSGGNLYDALGVPHDASLSTIKSAYRAKAVKYHPDKGGDVRVFAAVQEAYSVLSNSSRRKHYDETGRKQMTPEEALKEAMTKSAVREPEPDEVAVAQPEQRVELPPRLRAAVEGRSLEASPVPLEYDRPVSHITVSERDGGRTLHLVHTYPAIEDSMLQSGTVLLQMRCVPVSSADLNVEHRYRSGDYYGSQGVGQVRFCGPNVDGLVPGDWVVPLLEVDEDGDLVEDASAPGTGRTLLVVPAKRCARLGYSAGAVLSIGQMAVAKSIGAAYCMVEQHSSKLTKGATVLVNAANGVVGQTLVQLLSLLGFRVFAVVREHEGVELVRRRLEQELGCAKALIDDDYVRTRLEEMQVPLPELAFDGVGSESTMRIATALSKTGDIVCYGVAGGSLKQVLPSGWGKKWKGTVHQFSFDEWLQEDIKANSEKFNEKLGQASKLMSENKLKLAVKEFSTGDFQGMVQEAMKPGRCHAVVLHFPRLEDDHPREPGAPAPTSEVGSNQIRPDRIDRPAGQKSDVERSARRSWDLDFLDWEAEEEERTANRQTLETDLFAPDPVMDEMRIQKYVDDALAMPIAVELGAKRGEATAVLFWLPGAGEVPEEHQPWLRHLATSHTGLRVLIMKPKLGFKWFDTSDHEAVKLGLRFGVMDDDEDNPHGDPSKSRGELAFPSLEPREVEALQQVESAALGLARRAVLEEKALLPLEAAVASESYPKVAVKRERLPFFFGGFGQGGSVALFTAICMMPTPICGVAFCHSGVPCAGMLGKRLTEQTRKKTQLYALYDRADKEVPIAFPEALHQMFKLLQCDVSLQWLYAGDGHEFMDDAAAKTGICITDCLRQEFAARLAAEE